jgi:hypothetical protein
MKRVNQNVRFASKTTKHWLSSPGKEEELFVNLDTDGARGKFLTPRNTIAAPGKQARRQ